jgi:hypothetical protein
MYYVLYSSLHFSVWKNLQKLIKIVCLFMDIKKYVNFEHFKVNLCKQMYYVLYFCLQNSTILKYKY